MTKITYKQVPTYMGGRPITASPKGPTVIITSNTVGRRSYAEKIQAHMPHGQGVITTIKEDEDTHYADVPFYTYNVEIANLLPAKFKKGTQVLVIEAWADLLNYLHSQSVKTFYVFSQKEFRDFVKSILPY